jgi:hypothetical protein
LVSNQLPLAPKEIQYDDTIKQGSSILYPPCCATFYQQITFPQLRKKPKREEFYADGRNQTMMRDDPEESQKYKKIQNKTKNLKLIYHTM